VNRIKLPANQIKFFHQIKVSHNQYNIVAWY